jgi:hypothetical protein
MPGNPARALSVGAAGPAAGNGWRGPERICPGLGGAVAPGSGLALGAMGRPGAITTAGATVCGAGRGGAGG